MGTNYYIPAERCQSCGHQPKSAHIGKSSAGWCFSLHVIPELGLNSLEDWKQFWQGKQIYDEYGSKITEQKMLDVITKRSWHGETPRRHQIGYSCLSHGDGTWDLIEGEFS